MKRVKDIAVNRRGFLAGLTGAVTGGRKAVEDMTSLTLHGKANFPPVHGYGGLDPHSENRGWAWDALKKWANPAYIKRQKKEFYLDSLDVDVHALKSVSLGNKLRMSKDRKFEAYMKGQRSYLQRIWDGDDE